MSRHTRTKAPPAPAASEAPPPPPVDWRTKPAATGAHRAGFVALVGRPNVGKSTLLNRLLGRKVAAASPRPQTTRRRFRGILTLPGAQLIFVDTPGLFDGALGDGGVKGGYGELGAYMSREVKSAVGDVDAVAWIEEAPALSPEGPTPAQRDVIELLGRCHKPVVLVINKVDMVKKGALLPAISAWKDVLGFAAVVPVSALREDGLDRLVKELAALVPESVALFPDEDLTDASERSICEELIREKVMMRTGEEVPYAVAVEVLQFDESRRAEKGPKGGVIDIEANIHVERDGQKAIIVGKGGAKVKEIGILAREELEKFLGCRVMLRLFVKVSGPWTRTARGLKNLGYA